MKIVKKITVALYIALFFLYAISPIVASISNASPMQPISHDDNVGTPRLMIFELLADESIGKETAVVSADDDSDDILLRKKRAILSSKVKLEIVAVESPSIDRLQIDLLDSYDAPKTPYSSAQYFFTSGISPPSLS